MSGCLRRGLANLTGEIMEQILIGGYTLYELKAVQTAVKKDASKIISDAIAKAEEAMDEILSLQDDDNDCYDDDLAQINSLSEIAYSQLELAATVSSISDVEYYLPYSCDYSSDGYYRKFEDMCIENSDALDKMMDKLENMESQSRQWNMSTC